MHTLVANNDNTQSLTNPSEVVVSLSDIDQLFRLIAEHQVVVIVLGGAEQLKDVSRLSTDPEVITEQLQQLLIVRAE